jgi:predicted DCC family thiol-disulfide oxidoreductase YuxK
MAAALPDGVPATLPHRIVLYDGTCGLCHRYVRTLLALDRHGALHFSPLQGSTAASLRERHPEIPTELETIVFVEGDRVFTKSDALARAASHLPAPWHLYRWSTLVPRPIRDLLYGWIARTRYRIFGRYDTCRIPSPEQVARFLD